MAIRIVAILFSLGAGVALGATVYRAVGEKAPSADVPPPVATGATPAPPKSAEPTPSAIASASASAPVSSAEPPPAAEDPEKCLPTLFAPGTFSSAAGLSAVCNGKKVTDITKRVKEAIVKAGGGHVTDGMQEWAVLGIHEMAAVAALRGRCCPSAPPLEVPASPGSCQPLSDTLTEIAHAARRGVPDSEIEAAVTHFDSTARCIVRSGNTAAFGGVTHVDGGETTMFEKILHRAQSQ